MATIAARTAKALATSHGSTAIAAIRSAQETIKHDGARHSFRPFTLFLPNEQTPEQGKDIIVAKTISTILGVVFPLIGITGFLIQLCRNDLSARKHDHIVSALKPLFARRCVSEDFNDNLRLVDLLGITGFPRRDRHITMPPHLRRRDELANAGLIPGCSKSARWHVVHLLRHPLLSVILSRARSRHRRRITQSRQIFKSDNNTTRRHISAPVKQVVLLEAVYGRIYASSAAVSGADETAPVERPF